MPICRDLITKEIIKYILDKGKGLQKANHDNIYSASGDWLALGEK